MAVVSISVTEAARSFSDCINRARYQGITFILRKNGVAVARIVPEDHGASEDRRRKAPVGSSAAGPEDTAQANSIPNSDLKQACAENPFRREIW
jgi:antitoxin (DNA-binding transcriptional repressor) of toxin-antitoxin stability system